MTPDQLSRLLRVNPRFQVLGSNNDSMMTDGKVSPKTKGDVEIVEPLASMARPEAVSPMTDEANGHDSGKFENEDE